MRKNISIILAVMLLITAAFPTVFVSAEASAAAVKIEAFPGAEGGGMWTTGARGGENIEVYHVTKLTDYIEPADYATKKGTFRDAVSKSNRVVVFDVAGNIELINAVSIIGDNLTILGQTAPGDGICIKNNTVGIYGDNVILRYMRFRMGDECTIEDDSIGGRGINNVILDHCSMSWSVDECVSFYENTNFTMQWCIIAESLKQSVHAKGSHGYGGIWGGTNASFHHNLLAHHDSRNPRVSNGSVTGSDYDMSKQTELTDLRNNVIYNWGGKSAYGGQEAAPANLINCYYKYGPSTKSGQKSQIFELTSSGNGISYDWSTDLYVSGNYVYGSSTVTDDNSKGVKPDSGTKNYYVWTDKNINENAEAKAVHFRYENDYPVKTETAEEAYNSVLSGAGASVVRDSVDARIINDVKNGTGKLINSQTEVGGYPVLSGTKSKDSDNDGIPNEWEDKNGLNKNDKSDGLAVAANGYLNIENYANALADGSYVRDTAYDPDVPDFDPADDPIPSEEPTATPKPVTEFVSEWKADASDLNVENKELMPGLYNVIPFDREMSDTITYSDGSKFSYALTRKESLSDGRPISGGWDAENGISKGTGLKFTAPEDGIFTLYGYSVSGEKKFYVMPEGVKIDPKTDIEAFDNAAVYVNNCVGSSVPIFCEVQLEKGKTYYMYLDGSKMRFCYAKFEKFLPYEIENAEFDANKDLSVTLKQHDTSVSGGTLIIAEYGADSILKGVKTFAVEGTDIKDFSYVKPSDVDHINLYIWTDTTEIKPLSDSKQNLK